MKIDKLEKKQNEIIRMVDYMSPVVKKQLDFSSKLKLIKIKLDTNYYNTNISSKETTSSSISNYLSKPVRKRHSSMI